MRVKAKIKDLSQVCLADTPLGQVILSFTPKGLAALDFAGEEGEMSQGKPPSPPLDSMIEAVVKELYDFFKGAPTDFQAVPLDLQGTPFQIRVWQELRRIPRGRAISYREMAQRVGSPKGFRAVGQAIARNPIPIIIPCHRVIAADGSLGGYSSGIARKRWLIHHEASGEVSCQQSAFSQSKSDLCTRINLLKLRP
jgi:methylated-DNA-[protein]-cysteine S-methyltransferase